MTSDRRVALDLWLRDGGPLQDLTPSEGRKAETNGVDMTRVTETATVRAFKAIGEALSILQDRVQMLDDDYETEWIRDQLDRLDQAIGEMEASDDS